MRAMGAPLSQELLEQALHKMLLIRNFELRAEAAYLQGKIGGFFHSYIGQEAIQVAAVMAFGEKNWWVTTYRVHALALLLGATPVEVMAELLGRASGNAKGRGGSMHLYTERLLGGFGIVGGQIPIATGAAFSLKYQNKKDEIALCFLGDGAAPQGAFHESLNLASLWSLPCVYIIENNIWGMGTHYLKANAVKKLAEDRAAAYNMQAYTFDGTDFGACYEGFKQIHAQILQDSRPVLVEVIAERFKGHSISDPGLYRKKEALKESMQQDPILRLKEKMGLDDERFKTIDKKYREIAAASLKHAEDEPWPDIATLEQDVYAHD